MFGMEFSVGCQVCLSSKKTHVKLTQIEWLQKQLGKIQQTEFIHTIRSALNRGTPRYSPICSQTWNLSLSVTAHQTERSEPESLVLQAQHQTDSEGLSHLSGSGAGRLSNHRRATQAACTSAHPGYETGIMTPTLLGNALDRNHLSWLLHRNPGNMGKQLHFSYSSNYFSCFWVTFGAWFCIVSSPPQSWIFCNIKNLVGCYQKHLQLIVLASSCILAYKHHCKHGTLEQNHPAYLWTTLAMKSSVQIRASDSPLYSLQFTWEESCTSITTEREKVFRRDKNSSYSGRKPCRPASKYTMLLASPLTTH